MKQNSVKTKEELDAKAIAAAMEKGVETVQNPIHKGLRPVAAGLFFV